MNPPTDLKWTLPLSLKGPSAALHIWDADGHMVADLRGWGHLTGQGGLGLPADQAEAIQRARGQMMVDAVNAAATEPVKRHAFTRRTVADALATPPPVVEPWCGTFRPLTHFGQTTRDDICNDCGLPAARHPVATQEYERGYLDACADHIARADAGEANLTQGTSGEMFILQATPPPAEDAPLPRPGNQVQAYPRVIVQGEMPAYHNRAAETFRALATPVPMSEEERAADDPDYGLCAPTPAALVTQRAAEDATWAGAVTYVRDMAATVRSMAQKFVADPAMAELAKIRAEALDECADGMERAAAKARAAAPRVSSTLDAEPASDGARR